MHDVAMGGGIRRWLHLLKSSGERAVARSLDWPRGRGGRSVSQGPKRAVLGAAIAHAAGAEPTLLAVEPDLPLIIPGQDRKPIHEETKAMLRGTRKLGVLLTRE